MRNLSMLSLFNIRSTKPLPSYGFQVKIAFEKEIYRMASTICHKTLFPAVRSAGITGRKINNTCPAGAGLHKKSFLYGGRKQSVKFLKCGEVTNCNIGDHVELHGKISKTKGNQLILSDKSGAVELILCKNGKIKQIRILTAGSFVRLVGLVKKKATCRDNTETNEDSFSVLVNEIISVSPLLKERHCQNSLRLELLPEEVARCTPSSMHYFFRRSHNCGAVTEEMIGNNVTLCGWVQAKDGENVITLEDGHGSVLVNCTGEDKNVIPGAEDVAVEDLIFVKGVITPGPGRLNHVSAKELKIISNTIVEESSGTHNSSGLEYAPKESNSNNLEEKNLESVLRRLENNETSITLPDFNRYTLRSHNCGEINESLLGQTVHLMGWALYVRMNKFIVLKDKYGTVQLFIPDSRKDLQVLVESLLPESVISVKGTVSLRPQGLENKFMKTGILEVCVGDLQIISKSSALPIHSKSEKPSRLVLLKYRYLDLRHNLTVQKSLQMRCEILHKMRKFLVEEVGFLEVETPTLFRRTPGGAQEFIVPTRNKGEFYSLVQSPQQFKQLLMIGSIDRYFQIARCYRDETGQRDRQPEFTQLDIEMSFCNREGILNLIEDLIKFIWPKNTYHLVTPFPRLTYEEAMTTYGSDKPDTRFDCKIIDLTDAFRYAGTQCNGTIDVNSYMNLDDFAAHAFVIRKGMVSYSFIRSIVVEKKKDLNFPIFAIKVRDMESTENIFTRIFSESVYEEIRKRIRFEPEDIILLGLGPKIKLLKALGDIRILAGNKFIEHDVNTIERGYHFLWILDFPLFELVDDQIKSVHHPFTKPHPDDAHMLHTDPLRMRSLHYDLVLNGNEIGGGSIRIHDAAFQKEVLEKILKLNVSSLKHLLEALDSGAPIHGGFALGIDRFIAQLRGLSHINDVIAFPKSSAGRDAMSGAPCPISDEEKALYHIE